MPILKALSLFLFIPYMYNGVPKYPLETCIFWLCNMDFDNLSLSGL